MIFPFFQEICKVILVLFFILHGDLMFSLASCNYLDPVDIYTRFQVLIMDFEFSTGENVVFPIETYSYNPIV